MLRLKDLFKIDFSSKGGGKLADKIFNKYNITKEEREEVKNEIASGGGGGGTNNEYEYYRCRFDNLNTWAIRIENEDVLSGFNLINTLCSDFTWDESNYMGMRITFHYHASMLTGEHGWEVFMKVPKNINCGTIDAYSNTPNIIKNKNLIDGLIFINTRMTEILGTEEYESNIENIISGIKVSSYEEMCDYYKGYIDIINNL